MADDAPCRFLVLGPLQIERDGRDVPVRSPAHRAVLGVLLVHAGRPVPIDQIVDAAWPDDQPESPRGALHTILSRLRARLGDGTPIVSTAGGYLLDTDDLDAVEFDGLLDQAAGRPPVDAVDVLSAALRLWRGPAYADLAHLHAVQPEAVRLDERRAAATEDLAAHRIVLGDPAGALQVLAPQVEDGRLRERTCELQMTALHHAGRTSEALDVFRTFRTTLADELGLDPPPRLQELEHRILNQNLPAPDATGNARRATGRTVPDPAASPSPSASTAARPRRVGLRAERDRFIGRDELIGQVIDLITDPDVRLITLTGPGGVGKTRLADRVIRTSTDRFAGGAHLIELAPVRTPDAVATTVADALGVSDVADVRTIEQIAVVLSSEPTLLVLDNFEHVMAATGIVSELIDLTPDLTVVVTSREVLRLSGEHVVDVPPLDLPADVPGTDLSAIDSIALFVDRARAADRRFAPTDQDLRVIAEIVRRLDGLPLAIELAAARCRLFAPTELLNRLTSRLSGLGGPPRDLPNRHRTLRDTIGWSHDLLSAPHQDLFERLGVFAGGFSLDSAEILADDRTDVLDHVIDLCDRSLVRPAGSAGGILRFAMLETIREFAGERLEQRRDLDVIRRRHAEHFLDLAERLEPDYEHHRERRIIDRSTADHANFDQAADWFLAQGDTASPVRLGVVLWRAWWVRSRFRDGIVRMQAVLSSGADLSDHDRAHARFIQGHLAFGLSDFETAEPALREALELYEAVGDDRGVAQALTPLGVVTSATDPSTGEAILRRAVALADRSDETWTHAFAELAHGSVLVAQRRFSEATAALETSVALNRRLGTEVLLAYALTYLGRAYLGSTRLDAAARVLTEALERGARMRSNDVAARALVDTAALAAERGRHDRAAEALAAAEAVRAAVGSPVYLPDRPYVDSLTENVTSVLGDSGLHQVREAFAGFAVTDVARLAPQAAHTTSGALDPRPT